MSDNGEGLLVFMGFVVGGFIGAMITLAICDTTWREESVAHGAAIYVIEGNKAVFKWKDEVKE